MWSAGEYSSLWRVQEKCDLYSMGILFIALVTGKLYDEHQKAPAEQASSPGESVRSPVPLRPSGDAENM